MQHRRQHYERIDRLAVPSLQFASRGHIDKRLRHQLAIMRSAILGVFVWLPTMTLIVAQTNPLHHRCVQVGSFGQNTGQAFSDGDKYEGIQTDLHGVANSVTDSVGASTRWPC